MQFSVLLIRSDHLLWDGLRYRLQDHPEIYSIDEVTQVDQAVHAVKTRDPAVILIDANLPDSPLVPLVRSLHAATPSGKIVVIGEEKSLAYNAIETLRTLHTVAYVLWDDITGDAVMLCVTLVCKTNLLVASPSVADVVERRRHPRDGGPVLSDRERVILKGLCEGYTERQIARTIPVSEATVWRDVATLCAKFGVATPCALCAKAGRLGFMS